MCGIVGRVGISKLNPEEVLSTILHRGPDSNGIFQEGEVFLGHTRLSIQDLSEKGSQPMFSADGRFVIIFNGEIYNHLDVRTKLTEVSFNSTSDTETILYAYIKFGPAFLNMLNGIFALAIYDREEKEIFIARDQIGVKPLYISENTHFFSFSSELKSLLTFDIKRNIDPKAICNYLTFLWSPGERTPFKSVRKLLPGHYIKFSIPYNNDQTKSTRYYQLPFKTTYENLPEEQLIDLLEEKLVNAVSRQMLSDVPVGFFLSGGLDSSLLVAIAKKIYPNKKFPCFTIDIEGWTEGSEDFKNDIYYAKKVAEFLDVELNIVNANIDIVKNFDKMIWHLDEPQADAAPLNVLNICSLAREKGIKVLLGGVGGDDLFSGYRRHQALNYEKYFRLIPARVGKLIKGLTNLLPINYAGLRKIRKLTIDLDKGTNKRMQGYFSWLPLNKSVSLFSEEWQIELKNYDPNSFFDELNKQIPLEANLLNRMLYWEINSFLVDHNLNYTDKMAMAIGVEARVPFLDLELIEFSMKLPPEMKMKNNETKYILKKVAERYLPEDVIYRSKTGFGAPVRKWIQQDMNEMINERLNPVRIKEAGIFNSDKVWELINENKSNKIDASYAIWSILAIDSWITQFLKKN
jgi:asparagine synthase (glutamine-hydrolysing)